MERFRNTVTTAVAPAFWGTTYLTTTALLPANHPLFTAAMRSLPVGILLTSLLRQFPRGHWWWKLVIVGLLNFGFTFLLHFIGVYRLPGGVAAAIGSIQPLLVALLGWPVLGLKPARVVVAAGMLGMIGVAMLVLGGAIRLDPAGIAAACGAALATACGTLLVKRWGRPEGMSLLAYTGLQLLAGGIFLAPTALIFEGLPARFSLQNGIGYLYLCLCGTALAYTLWFRGIAHLPATSVTFLNLLIPIVASIAGFIAYGQSFTPLQLAGIATICCCIVVAQRAGAATAARRALNEPSPAAPDHSASGAADLMLSTAPAGPGTHVPRQQ